LGGIPFTAVRKWGLAFGKQGKKKIRRKEVAGSYEEAMQTFFKPSL
jgi:hypothetical protein